MAPTLFLPLTMNLTQSNYNRSGRPHTVKRLGAGPRANDLHITQNSSSKEINAVVQRRIKDVIATERALSTSIN